jgi:ribonucleoside-diphosphate reductase alpha chain
MLQAVATSPFLDSTAVGTWDAYFRWRDGGHLRDLSIECTWQRAARALGDVEPTQPGAWIRRVFEAQSRWQLVLDQRLLAQAGTPQAHWPDNPAAVLNAAAFVDAPFSAHASFDFAAFREVAALAVHCLDNALLHAAAGGRRAVDVGVGIIGLADALVLLGRRYDSPAARVAAAAIARALAEGCLAGSVRLARERGPLAEARTPLFPVLLEQLPPDLIADVGRYGLRHRRLTAIDSQPRLAAFANSVADALDPVENRACAGVGALTAVGSRRHPSYAIALARSVLGADPCNVLRPLLADVSLGAQIALRGAVQPWIDAPIDYPFHAADAANPRAEPYWRNLASAHRLGPLVIAG